MKEKSKRKNTGITLIALVITIVVLLILAGVSIATLTGENGILTRAREAREETEDAKEEEVIKLAVVDALTAGEGKLTTENLQKSIENQFGSDRKEKLKGTGPWTYEGERNYYRIKSNGEITPEKEPIELEDEVLLGYGTIDVVWLNTSNEVQLSPEEPNLYNGALKKVKWTESGEELNEDTSETFTGSDWYAYTAADNSSTDDYTKSRWANAKNEDGSYFVWIPRYAYRITYYADESRKEPIAYYDGRGLVNPEGRIITKLGGEEIDGHLDEGIKTVTDNGKSYIVHPAFMNNRSNNYENGGWDKDLSGIWVAKFEMSQETSTDGRNWTYSGTTSLINGNIFTTNSAKAENQSTNGEQIRAVSKASTKENTENQIASWRYINIANMYTNSLNYDREKESHLIKNSEWGAVVYLAHSQYGRNGYEITINNNSNFYTGMAGDSTSAGSTSGGTNYYNTVAGGKASTTGNVYGIFDLSGGAYEYVSAFNKNYNPENENNYFKDSKYLNNNNIHFATVNGKSTKYTTAYSGENLSSGTALEHRVGKTGDATKEVLTGAKNDDKNHWNQDCSHLLYSSYPFFRRGGHYGYGIGGGIFYSYDNDGNAHDYYSFRVVLAE